MAFNLLESYKISQSIQLVGTAQDKTDNSIEVNCHSIASWIVLKRHRAKSSLGTSQHIIAHFVHFIGANGIEIQQIT